MNRRSFLKLVCVAIAAPFIKFRKKYNYADPEIAMACHGTDEEIADFMGAGISILVHAEYSLDNGETWKTLDISGDNSIRPYWELTLLKGAGDNINDNT